MRPRTVLVVLLLPVLATVACGDPETAVQWTRVQAEWDDAVTELGELGSEVGDLLAIQADRLHDAVEAKLGDLDGHMETLSAAAEEASAEAQVRMRAAMVTVAEKRAVLEARLEELGASSGAAAEQLREGVARAYDDLVEAMENAGDAWQEATPDDVKAVSGEVR